MNNENQPKQDSGLPEQSLIGSADAADNGTERKTPEQRASLIAGRLLVDGRLLLTEHFNFIESQIREAVEVERFVRHRVIKGEFYDRHTNTRKTTKRNFRT